MNGKWVIYTKSNFRTFTINHTVFGSYFTITIRILNLNISRFLSIFSSFIRFIQLPDSYLFIIIKDLKRFTYKPWVCLISQCSWSQFLNFLFIVRKSKICSPSKILLLNVYRVQRHINTKIFCFTNIFHNFGIPIGWWNLTIHQYISSIWFIYIYRTWKTVIKETEIHT